MSASFRNIKLKIFRETLVMVFLVLILKVFVSHLGWEWITPSVLLSGIISGSIFVLGFILSGTYRDYKESEYIPVNISVAIESIYQDVRIFKIQYKRFDLEEVKILLQTILLLFRKDLVIHSKKAYFKTLELSFIFAKLEKLGIPANYIVKLKQDQSTILRGLLRINYFQRIQPIPSAFILVQSIVFGLIGILIITKLNTLLNELIVIGVLSFVFIYLLKLIHVLEQPFHPEGKTMDDVSLFQLKELQARIAKDM